MTLEQLKTEIKKINEGCKEQIEKYDLILECGDWLPSDFDRIRVLCPSCQSKKQGLIQGAKMMIEDEISFLEDLLWENDCYEGARFITQKLSELKQNNWLEKICN